MTTTTAPPPVATVCRRLRVRETSIPVRVATAVAEAVRRQGTVEVEAIGAGALQLAIEAITTARLMLAHDGREIVVAPSLVANAAEEGPILRLRVLRAALSAGQLHELLRAQLQELVGGDDVCLDAMADRLTAALLVGDPG